jgi:hypothetical protein
MTTMPKIILAIWLILIYEAFVLYRIEESLSVS